MYSRDERLFDNYPIDDISQIQAFWKAAPDIRNRVFEAFRRAGAKMIVTDGIFCRDLASQWPSVFPVADTNPKLSGYYQMNSRYLDLLQTPVEAVHTPGNSHVSERHSNYR